MEGLKIAVIGNFSDNRCGFKNFSEQTVTALARAGHDVTKWDGTYSVVYARREAGIESFLPPDADSYDVLHTVWHPATMNHYAGATWPTGPVKSVWNGCPAAWCPFNDAMQVKWGVLGREEGHRQIWYPIPDWIDNLPEANPAFTVGYSGVRGDGRLSLETVCRLHGWQMNFSDPAVWLSQEDEIRRLARSTVNVCWYGGEHDDRSGSAMVCLASKRPLLVNTVRMMTHLYPYPDQVYIMPNGMDWLDLALTQLYKIWQQQEDFHQPQPTGILAEKSWSAAVKVLEVGWEAAR